MSVAISRVPAATTLQDMRSRGPPEDREEESTRVIGEGRIVQDNSARAHSQKNKARRLCPRREQTVWHRREPGQRGVMPFSIGTTPM